MTDNCPLSKAQWIWPGDTPYANNTYAQYRRDFEIKRLPKKAALYISADQNYMLYINGSYVGRGPARGYQDKWSYDEYDVARFLQVGHNWISVRQYSGGISTYSYIFQWRSGMLCAMKWKGFELLSDASWQSRVCPAYRKDVKRVSVQMNLQEQVDARLDAQQWIRSAKGPRSWKITTSAIPYSSMPWHSMKPREIPNLSNTMMAYQNACFETTGKCAKGYRDTNNMVEPMRRESNGLKWKQAGAGKVRDEKFHYELSAAGRGKFSAVTLDLGKLGVGTLNIDVRGAAGNETLDIHFCEVLNDDGSPYLPSTISMGARVILRKGRTQHELQQMMGHRYVTLVLREAPKPVRISVSLRETVYPLNIKGRFDCSDDVINGIHGICIRTQQICSLDSYVDTPWREQAQWWGDARVQAVNTFHLCNDARLLARGIRCIAEQEVPNGLTYGHAPTNGHAAILPDFSITWVMTIWDYYWQTGSTELLHEQWQRIERLLGYYRGEGRDKNGLLKYDRRYWLFLDWSTIPKEEGPTLLNMWYLIMLDKLATLTKLAGMDKRSKALKREYNLQKRLVNKLLFDEKAGLYCDGLDKRGKRLKSWSIHSQTAAIMCGLKRKKHGAMVEQCLLPYLRGVQTDQPVPSSFWVHYVYEVMTAAGYGREVVNHIRKNYGRMIEHGGTWEIFKWKAGRGSVSHAWSAHPIKHLAATLGGVTQIDASWSRVRFSPVFDVDGVDRVDVKIPTPGGMIHAKWKRGEDMARVLLTLPKGVVGEVDLPGIKAEKVNGSNKWEVRL